MIKGIILAGGLGSRLYPLTKATNKHLLPVGSEPMLFHPIHQLTNAGIDNILVVTSTLHMGDVVRCLTGPGRWQIQRPMRPGVRPMPNRLQPGPHGGCVETRALRCEVRDRLCRVRRWRRLRQGQTLD